jgi:large subunit ribosomal protein L15
MKGQKARGTIPARFEGGQLPLQQRVPKLRGFNNPFRVAYNPVNLDTIEASTLDEVTPDTLREHGLVKKTGLVKVLGRGELNRAITVRAHAFSRSAERAITDAGGTVEVLPRPWGDGRPPARGNALTNR